MNEMGHIHSSERNMINITKFRLIFLKAEETQPLEGIRHTSEDKYEVNIEEINVSI
jgi:hypothetical protein